MVPRVLPEEQRYDLELLTVQDTRNVNGNVKKGRRPFIYYEGVPYRNDLLAKNYNLVGTKLTLQINIEDISKLKAFLPNGNEIGYLRAAGKWGARKHSLRTRKEINKLVNNKMIFLTSSDDPLEKYDAFCASQKEKRYMNKIADQQRIKRNQNKASTTEIVEIDDTQADALEDRNIIDFEETSTKSESNKIIEPPPELKHLFRTISF
jgi:putative transposase